MQSPSGHMKDHDLPVACTYSARQSAEQRGGTGVPTLDEQRRAEQSRAGTRPEIRVPSVSGSSGQGTFDGTAVQDRRLEPGGHADTGLNKGTGHF